MLKKFERKVDFWVLFPTNPGALGRRPSRPTIPVGAETQESTLLINLTFKKLPNYKNTSISLLCSQTRRWFKVLLSLSFISLSDFPPPSLTLSWSYSDRRPDDLIFPCCRYVFKKPWKISNDSVEANVAPDTDVNRNLQIRLTWFTSLDLLLFFWNCLFQRVLECIIRDTYDYGCWSN